MKNIYYGWFMLAALTLMYATTNGVGAYALTVMRPLQIKSFGLDAQSAAFLPTLLFLTIAVVSPFIGRMLDRYNPRNIIAIGAFGAIGLIFSLAYVTSYTVLCVFYVLYGICMALSGIMSFMYLINKWFDHYKGLATGIMILGSSLGGIIFPRIAVMAGADWQTSCMYLGIVSAIFLLPALLLIKPEPAVIGSVPDGAYFPERHNAKPAEPDRSLSDALRSPKFYMVLLVTAILWFCIKGYHQNHGFVIKDLGQTPAFSAKMLGYFSLMAIVGKLFFGYLSDKIIKEYTIVAAIVVMAADFFIMHTLSSNPLVLTTFALIAGFGFGGAFTLIQVWVASIYRGKSYGSVLGIVIMVDELSGAAGMIVLGTLRKMTGSFKSGFELMVMLCVVAIVSAVMVRRFKSQ
ncbi:MAG: MFS transporter [Sphingobacteriales bacterium]|nr:MAG: MFS transporter [Sphingobacteriales bacterium]